MLKYIIALLAVFHSAYAINGKCRLLVLGGGSQRGAFQAGAISGLITYLPKGEAQWDVVVGNGIGAFNALFVSQQPLGSESFVNTTIQNFWLNFKRSQIYKNWFGGRLIGLYFRTGLYNSAPLKKTVNELFDGSFYRTVILGVTDVKNNAYKTLNSTNFDPDTMIEAVIANFNGEGEFEVVNYRNSQYVSGEVAFVIDPTAGILSCMKLNYKQNQIIMDVVLLNHAKLAPYNAKGKNALHNYRRFVDIQDYHSVFQRITSTINDYPTVYNRSLIIMPDQFPIDSNTPFDYETGKGNLEKMFNAGIATVKAALKA